MPYTDTLSGDELDEAVEEINDARGRLADDVLVKLAGVLGRRIDHDSMTLTAATSALVEMSVWAADEAGDRDLVLSSDEARDAVWKAMGD